MARYGLPNLIAQLNLGARHNEDTATIIAEVKHAIERFLATPDAIPKAYLDAANPNRPSQFIIYRSDDDRLFATLVIWLTGQIAPIHDHQTWAIIGQYSGSTRERRFRRIDDGSRPGFARLQQCALFETAPGDITVLNPPDNDIHCPENPWPEPSITIHVYGRYLGGYERNTFNLADQSVTPFLITKYDRLPDLSSSSGSGSSI
jgi:predicted metal-dependent enzyme (double-stranded beta helix superfamily)